MGPDSVANPGGCDMRGNGRDTVPRRLPMKSEELIIELLDIQRENMDILIQRIENLFKYVELLAEQIKSIQSNQPGDCQ
jgi:hypothetical protein